ncbi:MAG: ribosome small subunit-dependent GTPase A [Salinivirgaceae bacterium]
MELEDLGYNPRIDALRKELNIESFDVGRVVLEHKERYVVLTEKGAFEAELTGNMRFSAKYREDFPVVGDWVALTIYEPDFSVIHRLIPRHSLLQRQAVGQFATVQAIAANVDYALLVQAADRDFNLNRLERYLTLCYASRVNPIIVLSKTDLIDEQTKATLIEQLSQRIKGVPILTLSNYTRDGFSALRALIEKGKTYCLLGSSGVGKSSLLNNLSEKQQMQTGSISESSGKGKHITSHRELVVLENGGILIDNPGMREVGLVDAEIGLETTFDSIVRLSEKCRYSDCTHSHEKGCAVIEALEKGEIDANAYHNYLKIEKEKVHFETSLSERKKKEKVFGKMVKDYYKKKIKDKEQ